MVAFFDSKKKSIFPNLNLIRTFTRRYDLGYKNTLECVGLFQGKVFLKMSDIIRKLLKFAGLFKKNVLLHSCIHTFYDPPLNHS